MAEQIKEKVDLDNVTHSVRGAQAILQYGVGAMVDFPDQTLTTAAPEYWNCFTRIYDERFAKALGVDCFAIPTKISYVRFPEWYFCPKCREFQPLSAWIAKYKKTTRKRYNESDEHMVKHMRCPTCNQELVVARVVTVCKDGHINDFPWIKWVHTKSHMPICTYPSLKISTGASGAEGLEGVKISCSCGASTTLVGAFGKDAFEKIDFHCEGGHPHTHIKEKCDLYPQTLQRGASSVYFPVVYSSLVIPPYADKLNEMVEHCEAFARFVAVINDEEPEDRDDIIRKRLPKWSEQIALEIGRSATAIERILSRKWLEEHEEASDVTSVKYRAEEYSALNGEIPPPPGMSGDFSRESIQTKGYRLPHIKSVSLIDKVRVVNALVGFSRLNPVMGKEDKGFVHVKKSGTRWYPAYEVRGEGIFIEFEQQDIDAWIRNNPSVIERAEYMNDNYAKSFIGQSHPRRVSPKFVMLHTLSHLLIKQLSFECGYSIASLSERIYCAEKTEGKQMAGIFIYTASGDSEGTLGGLVRQGRPDAFPRIFHKAIKSARVCANDPVCILSRGQGRDSLNLAACHACGLLPETCCEERNGFLDRGMIVGTFKEKEIGFWEELL